jgi:hypothetical protein
MPGFATAALQGAALGSLQQRKPISLSRVLRARVAFCALELHNNEGELPTGALLER